jgi:hypothetical protein
MIIPRKGDYWEFKMPGKSKRTKEIDHVCFEWHRGEWDPETCRYLETRHPRAHWVRQPKGRYTSLRIKWLLKHGRRISTKVERDAHFLAQVNRRRAELGKRPLEKSSSQ